MDPFARPRRRILGASPWPSRRIVKVGPNDAAYQWVLDIADRADPKVRSAFLKAVARAQSSINDAELRAALEAGDIDAALAALNLDRGMLEGLKHDMPVTINDIFVETAHAAMERLLNEDRDITTLANSAVPPGGSITSRFDIRNPKSQEFIQNYNFDLIRQITNDQREAIRGVIANAFQYGGHPYQRARIIRDSIGLTDNQSMAVANYRRALESNDAASLDRALRDARFDPTVERALSNDAALPQEQIDIMVDRYGSRMLDMRAETIARTETLRAANAGMQDAWGQAADNGLLDPDTVVQQWLVTPDDRLCPYCAEMPELNADGVALDEPFIDGDGAEIDAPPLHPNCFPGHTLVASSSQIAAYSRRAYNGNLVVVRTASGNELSCTPNHPILTRRGWIGAGLLKEGDDLVSGAFREGFGFGNPHNENAPSHIHEVAEAFGRAPHVTTAPVPMSTEDFHGDGGGSKIAVIGTDRLLRRKTKAARRQHSGKNNFALANIVRPLLNSLGPFEACLNGLRHASNRIVCREHLAFAGVNVHPAPLHRLGSTLTSQRDPHFAQSPRDSASADAVLAAQLIDGSAGQVVFDKVVRIGWQPFSGHVYNLETEGGWYVANGVIVHNCRCTIYLTSI